MSFADVPAPPVPMYQSPVEFGALWEFVAAREPRRIVEIGSLYGGTLWCWLHMPGVEEVVSIDLLTEWQAIRADVVEARKLWPTWPTFDGTLTIIDGDSRDSGIAARVGDFGRPLDVVFIDGDHSAPADDFALWAPRVRPGGIVAFHDTVPNGHLCEPKVVELVATLKRRHASIEFFEPAGAGITAFVV
jgi:predicted O-methyltransferase YrrM